MSSNWERLRSLRSHANRLQYNVGYFPLDTALLSTAGIDQQNLMDLLENGLRDIMRRPDIEDLLNQSADFVSDDYSQKLEDLCVFLNRSVNADLLRNHNRFRQISGKYGSLDTLLNIISGTDWRFVMVSGKGPKLFIPQSLTDGLSRVDNFNSIFNRLSHTTVPKAQNSTNESSINQAESSVLYDEHVAALKGVVTLLSWFKRNGESCQGCKVFLQSPEWHSCAPPARRRKSRLRLLLCTCRADVSKRFQECWLHDLAVVDGRSWQKAHDLCDQIHRTRELFRQLRLAAFKEDIYVYSCDSDQDLGDKSDDESVFGFDLYSAQKTQPKTLKQLITDGVFLPPGTFFSGSGPRFDRKKKRVLAAALVASFAISLISGHVIQSWNPQDVYLPINSAKKLPTCLPFLLCLSHHQPQSKVTRPSHSQSRPAESNVSEAMELQACLLAKLLLDIEAGRCLQLPSQKEDLEERIIEERSGDPEGPTTAYLTATLGCLNFLKSCQFYTQRLSAGGHKNCFVSAVKLTCSEIIQNIMKERESLTQLRQKRRRESDFDGKDLGSWPEQSSGATQERATQSTRTSALPIRKKKDRKKRLKWADEQEASKETRGLPDIGDPPAAMGRWELTGNEAQNFVYNYNRQQPESPPLPSHQVATQTPGPGKVPMLSIGTKRTEHQRIHASGPLQESLPAKLKLSRNAYIVGWICPLEVEQVAAWEMLDEEHEMLQQPRRDSNVYKLGSINGYNVVIAGLPQPGNCSAAMVITQMRTTFPNLEFCLLVGIGGGVPVETDEGMIRLGHVVVGKPTGDNFGTLQYDHGKALESRFERTGALAPPPAVLLNAAQSFAAYRARLDVDPIWEDIMRIRTSRRQAGRFKYPGVENDHLYPPTYKHKQPGVSCEVSGCDPKKRIKRPVDDDGNRFVVVHRGTIASGELVVKSAKLRDRLAQQHRPLSFEMEAAGVLTGFPCMVIRGISDYCDSHKNDRWHGFAAAAAAAYARQLFFQLPVREIRNE